MVQLSSFLLALPALSSVASASHQFLRSSDSKADDNSTSTTSVSNFNHPGVFVSQSQLDFVKEKVNAKEQPWAKAFDNMMSNNLLDLSRDPSPRFINEREDAIAAYGHALAYGITGDEKHAKKAELEMIGLETGILVMLESAIGISVLLDDKETYESAMEKFKGRVARKPRNAPPGIVGFWHDQSDFKVDGIAQETCRDFVHTGYGLASISHVAETALIQGENLYETEIGDRLRAGLEFHSEYQLGADQPSFLCPGNELVRNLEAVTEPGFNAFSTQMGHSMPNTKKLTEKFRKENAFGNQLFVAFETLTHAGNPAAFSGNSTLSVDEPSCQLDF
ncbi:hypothetical protein DL96DRAFT_1814145 [Flagelloscypha sp. PMI_526]|nr:hypothetical protein DL96DRAFT_1814145 [Flagelloscypha sp. PMI_526]